MSTIQSSCATACIAAASRRISRSTTAAAATAGGNSFSFFISGLLKPGSWVRARTVLEKLDVLARSRAVIAKQVEAERAAHAAGKTTTSKRRAA
jgi:hypothetical protein